LVSDKGADILLSAFSELIKDSLFFEQTKKFKFSFTLSIIGDGPELLNLKEHAEKLKVAHLVSFVGPLKGEQLVQKLNEHQILVVPSIWEEPFGVVALEGAACGCLVVGSSGGGLVDAIGDSGLLFKRGDIGDLVLMLKKAFYFSENQKEVLSKKRREKLLNHTQDAVGLRYLQVIEKAFNNKKLVYES
jgi:glycosyltransferase involved in cell wall biosynthesis